MFLERRKTSFTTWGKSIKSFVNDWWVEKIPLYSVMTYALRIKGKDWRQDCCFNTVRCFLCNHNYGAVKRIKQVINHKKMKLGTPVRFFQNVYKLIYSICSLWCLAAPKRWQWQKSLQLALSRPLFACSSPIPSFSASHWCNSHIVNIMYFTILHLKYIKSKFTPSFWSSKLFSRVQY